MRYASIQTRRRDFDDNTLSVIAYRAVKDAIILLERSRMPQTVVCSTRKFYDMVREILRESGNFGMIRAELRTHSFRQKRNR